MTDDADVPMVFYATLAVSPNVARRLGQLLGKLEAASGPIPPEATFTFHIRDDGREWKYLGTKVVVDRLLGPGDVRLPSGRIVHIGVDIAPGLAMIESTPGDDSSEN